MDGQEFLFSLKGELERANCTESEYVLSRYEEYFELRRQDGYTDAETLKRLKSPREIVAPILEARAKKEAGPKAGRRAFGDRSGLLPVFTVAAIDFLAGLFFVLMGAMWLGGAADCISLVYAGAALIGGKNPLFMLKHVEIYFADYWSGALIGLSLMVLAALIAMLLMFFAALLRQLFRAVARIDHNIMSFRRARAYLPPFCISFGLSRQASRRLRMALGFALILFSLCFALGFISASVSAGEIRFWSAWKWV